MLFVSLGSAKEWSCVSGYVSRRLAFLFFAFDQLFERFELGVGLLFTMAKQRRTALLTQETAHKKPPDRGFDLLKRINCHNFASISSFPICLLWTTYLPCICDVCHGQRKLCQLPGFPSRKSGSDPRYESGFMDKALKAQNLSDLKTRHLLLELLSLSSYFVFMLRVWHA